MLEQVKICEGISDISDSYNGFLIDQWGTLHNGSQPYDGVVEALKNLRQRGKQIILISNSGHRADVDGDRLAKIGISSDCYDHIVTSAEMTWQNLNNRADGVFKNMGKKCFLLSRHENRSVVEGVDDLTIVDDIDDADFVLLTGSDAPEKTLEDYYNPILKKASQRHLKMICANPETTITIDGVHYMGSGKIAGQYEEFGGVVTYIGKPFPSIFQYALSLFKGIYPSQICMIGDGFANDIRGAKYLDMDSAFIASGMHMGSLGKVSNTNDIHKVLKMLGVNHGVLPTYFVPKFHWGKALPDRKNKRKKTTL
jgi:HAD superfamily hydrolase (TIGR01459 family)